MALALAAAAAARRSSATARCSSCAVLSAVLAANLSLNSALSSWSFLKRSKTSSIVHVIDVRLDILNQVLVVQAACPFFVGCPPAANRRNADPRNCRFLMAPTDRKRFLPMRGAATLLGLRQRC